MLHIYGATDRGMMRETNEDRFAGEVFDQGSGYAVVCDGMGGEVGGGIAAGIAAEEVRRMIESSLRSHMEERSLPAAAGNGHRRGQPGGIHPQRPKRRGPDRHGQYPLRRRHQ